MLLVQPSKVFYGVFRNLTVISFNGNAIGDVVSEFSPGLFRPCRSRRELIVLDTDRKSPVPCSRLQTNAY